MAFTVKSKRLGYDNIATGSATGRERIVPGGGEGDSTTKESGENRSASYVANRHQELIMGMGGATSSGAWTGEPSSATTPYRTSDTSDTSAIGERL